MSKFKTFKIVFIVEKSITSGPIICINVDTNLISIVSSYYNFELLKKSIIISNDSYIVININTILSNYKFLNFYIRLIPYNTSFVFLD